MAAEENQARWECYFVDVVSGLGDDVSVTVVCNGKRVVVDFLPSSSLDGTIEGPLIERYTAACLAEDDEGEEAVLREIEDLIYDTGRPIFTRLAPPTTKGSQLPDLHSILYPETISFRFATVNDKAELIQQERPLEQNDPPFPMKINNDLSLPKYSSKDIQVLEKLRGQGYITRVLVDGEERCCKCRDPIDSRPVEREFDCLRKIALSQFGTSIRVPKLVGLVESANDGQVIGILEEFIPTHPSELWTLHEMDTSTVSKSRRKKWASQIRETVDLLHEVGVIWGDGKPHNVLIHRDTDDAWLIDFGGSWTDDWVDEELMETREGDEQAVMKILDFLAV